MRVQRRVVFARDTQWRVYYNYSTYESVTGSGLRMKVQPAANLRTVVPLGIDMVEEYRHMAHTLEDTITLADIAGIGVCIDIHPCWFEGGLRRRFNRAASILGLVQVSDYVLGDKAAPCRAVPGDGAIPLERILGDLLEEGYRGVFDLELLGPRIESEGARAATKRAAENLSGILAKLGA